MSHVKILVMKGFVHSVDWSNAHNEHIMKECMKLAQSFDIIAFDGDLYKKSSYTFVLNTIMQTYKHKSYIAYKKQKNCYKLNSTYKGLDHDEEETGYDCDLKIISVPDTTGFAELSQLAVNDLSKYGTVSFCFLGGGPIATKEYDDYKKQNHQMFWFDVTR